MEEAERVPSAEIEAIARAICSARGWNPDTCLFGGGSASHDGKTTSYCSVWMWQNCVPDTRAAIIRLDQVRGK